PRPLSRARADQARPRELLSPDQFLDTPSHRRAPPEPAPVSRGAGQGVLLPEACGPGRPRAPETRDDPGGEGAPRVPLRGGRAGADQPCPDGSPRDPPVGITRGQRRRPGPTHL